MVNNTTGMPYLKITNICSRGGGEGVHLPPMCSRSIAVLPYHGAQVQQQVANTHQMYEYDSVHLVGVKQLSKAG